jgi:hypothetical protein
MKLPGLLIRVTAVLFGVCCFGCIVAGTRAAEVDVERILASWKNRQQQTGSLRFSWTEQQTYARGSELSLEMPERMNPGRKVIPPEDLVVSVPFQLSLDGDKMRYAYDGHLWYHKDGKQYPQRYVSVFDGSTSKEHWPSTPSGYDQGIVRREKYNLAFGNLHVTPVLATYRPLDSRTRLFRSFSPGEYTVSAQPGLVQGCSCVILTEKPKRADDMVRSLWIDPARHLILRYGTSRQGRVLDQTDIDYRDDGKGGWVPSAWEIARTDLFHADRLRMAYKATVTDYAVNQPVDPADFQLEFPPGTWVTDETIQSEGRASTDYLVRPGGKNRMIVNTDMGATYEQLLNSESGMALRTPRSGFRLLHFFGLILLPLALLAWFGWRWSRRKTSPGTTGA